MRNSKGRFTSNKHPLYKYDSDLLNYLAQEKVDTSFLNAFWGLQEHTQDFKVLKEFSEFVKLRLLGNGADKISKKIKVSKRTISKWIWKNSIPEIIQLLEYNTKLDSKKLWLSLNSTRGGKLTGPWISVPKKIVNYQDLKHVLEQVKLNPKFYEYTNKFNIKDITLELRINLFAFLLGVMVGDAGKCAIKRKRFTNRRITLSLTKKYKSNKKFGEFVELCLFNLGLDMNRIKDDGPNIKSKHYFYRWSSQSSQLIQWLFHVCLGLNDKELTSYNPIRAEWILKMPREFRVWFLQGVADSDGYIDFCSGRAGIVTKPNKDYIIKLFTSFDIKHATSKLHKGSMDAVTTNIKNANSLPLFSPLIKNYRYTQMKTLANAKRFSHHWPNWFAEVVDNKIQQELRPSEIIKSVLAEYNIAITSSRIYKRKQMKNKICLGIESTALAKQ
jgi:hypothetical protein